MQAGEEPSLDPGKQKDPVGGLPGCPKGMLRNVTGANLHAEPEKRPLYDKGIAVLQAMSVNQRAVRRAPLVPARRL